MGLKHAKSVKKTTRLHDKQQYVHEREKNILQID